jgi:hypothetical protein
MFQKFHWKKVVVHVVQRQNQLAGVVVLVVFAVSRIEWTTAQFNHRIVVWAWAGCQAFTFTRNWNFWLYQSRGTVRMTVENISYSITTKVTQVAWLTVQRSTYWANRTVEDYKWNLQIKPLCSYSCTSVISINFHWLNMSLKSE